MNITERKRQLRKSIKEEFQKLSEEQIKVRSLNIFKQIETLKIFQEANVLMVYWSMKDEVFTHDFILEWYKKKDLLLPVIDNKDLFIRKFEGMDSMLPHPNYGIYEPLGKSISKKKSIDIIIVPGVAFDKKNNRLGRGKGYYDRFLSEIKAIKLGICFDFQLLERIPKDEFDVPVDMVLVG